MVGNGGKHFLYPDVTGDWEVWFACVGVWARRWRLGSEEFLGSGVFWGDPVYGLFVNCKPF